jgi:hypothetical protein
LKRGQETTDLEVAREIDAGIARAGLCVLRQTLVQGAVRYARTRKDWQVSDLKRRKELNQIRRDSCNILSRNMAKMNEDATWRELLGKDRKEIGDLACYLHCLLCLAAQ